MDNKTDLMLLLDLTANDVHERDFWDVAIERISSLKAELDKTCKWAPNEAYDGDCYWETECGNAYSITEGTPADNKMKFCVYCGGKLLETLTKDG